MIVGHWRLLAKLVADSTSGQEWAELAFVFLFAYWLNEAGRALILGNTLGSQSVV